LLRAFTPYTTAHMGHWAERLLPEVKERLGIKGDEQDAELLEHARQGQALIEQLTAHQFEGGTRELHIDLGGLPFAPTLDTRTSGMRTDVEAWPIPDPVDPEFANVLQVSRRRNPPHHAVPKSEALSAAAAVLAMVHRNRWLWLAPRLWFVEQGKARPAAEFGRGLIDPGRHVYVPVAAGEVEGWWFQVSRRVFFVTKETPDEPGLVEPLTPERGGMVLVAGEPILIVARVMEHPSDWAFVARVWVADAMPRHPRAWRTTSRAVHAHGLPILCLDEASTPEEVVAQLLLVAYWHGYLGGDESALIPAALASAFPRDVARVMHGTGASGPEAAASFLFERLLRPGFDPTRGAGSIRNYIARHATTLVSEHRSALAVHHPWDELGIKERHYYKLLARFAEQGPDGRRVLDHPTKAKIRDHLEKGRRRQAELALLRGRGFTDEAARKWLQRHDLDAISTAQPRRPRTVR